MRHIKSQRMEAMYNRWIKTALDFIFASILLLILWPLILLLAIFIRVFLGSPILFKQLRPGLHEKPFVLYKFRTMRDQRDANGVLLDDAERLTRFGRMLRSLSLDELPTLFNALKGEMSLIGPRPLLMEYLPYYLEYQKKRHHVKPGMTGWAQINGRNLLSWDKKFELDVWYVENCSFILDCKIFFLTILKILKREGISAIDHVTMTRFDVESKNAPVDS